MKIVAILALACGAIAQNEKPSVINGRFETRNFSGNLASEMRGTGPEWFGYGVKTAPKDDHFNCDTHINGPVRLEGSNSVAVLFRVAGDKIEKVRTYSLDCQFDAGGLPLIWVANVPAGASLSFLEKQALIFDGAMVAIAQHADAQADAVLERLARLPQINRVREKAIFWLGASRGAKGVAILRDLLAHEGSERIRDRIVFALSVSKQPEAQTILIQTARSDGSAHIRGQAIFWLAQKASKLAASTITDAVDNDPEISVKKRAVFALSQLPKEERVPRLIEIARSQKNLEVRKQAIFWLGQSGDPRALSYLEQILSK